jgi:hypothetical protein
LAVTVFAIATPLSTSGRFIVDAHGKRVRLTGVNWYGASEDIGVPAGLDCVDRNTLTEYDVDWCWWALNPTHGQSCTPGTNTIHYYWGAPEPYGLLTLDWTSVGYPAVVTMLQTMMQPHTGPGIG